MLIYNTKSNNQCKLFSPLPHKHPNSYEYEHRVFVFEENENVKYS